MTNQARVNWDNYLLAIATTVSARTDCRRGKVGAVLVDPQHHIVGTGYPGTAPGRPGCLDGACPRGQLSLKDQPPGTGDYDSCISIHAEVNALLHAERTRYVGGTIYVTREPCLSCYKVIQGAGLARVVYRTDNGFISVNMHTWSAVKS